MEDFFTFGWHDQQLRMTSEMAEHGYCVFAKDVAVLGSRVGLDSRVDIAWEMLTSTHNAMALGKLLRHGRRTDQTLCPPGQSKLGLAVTSNPFARFGHLIFNSVYILSLDVILVINRSTSHLGSWIPPRSKIVSANKFIA